MIKSGIYKIANKTTNKIYIGSAVNIDKRWNIHINELDKNIHSNSYLQNAWNKYGREDFIFLVIENTDRNKKILIEREQYYLDLEKPYIRNIGYNIYKTANSPLGYKFSKSQKDNLSLLWKKKYQNGYINPTKGIERSQHSKEKQSLSMKELYKTKIPEWKGKQRNEDTKEKIRLKNSGMNSPLYGLRGKDHPAYGKQLRGVNHPNYGKKALNSINVQLIKDNIIMDFSSVKEAANFLDISRSTLRSYKNRIYNGFLIKFNDPNETK